MRRVLFVLPAVVLSLTLFADARPHGTRFAVAIERGDLDAIKVLIEEDGASADTPIVYGEYSLNPLHKASWEGEVAIVEYLLSKGAKINALDGTSKATALMHAVRRGNAEIVKVLLAAKTDITLRDMYDFNAFTTAVSAGNQEIAGLLLAAGAKVDEGSSGLTPMIFAVSAGNIETIRFLVAHGADVNQGAKTGEQTALISAILAAQIEVVKTLIELKANVNTKMKDGGTPLKIARNGDQEDIVALLVAAGAKQ